MAKPFVAWAVTGIPVIWRRCRGISCGGTASADRGVKHRSLKQAIVKILFVVRCIVPFGDLRTRDDALFQYLRDIFIYSAVVSHIASQAIHLVVHEDRRSAPLLICLHYSTRFRAHLGLLVSIIHRSAYLSVQILGLFVANAMYRSSGFGSPFFFFLFCFLRTVMIMAYSA